MMSDSKFRVSNHEDETLILNKVVMTKTTYVEWVMLNVAHVRFRPFPEMFGGILGSLDSVLPPGFLP